MSCLVQFPDVIVFKLLFRLEGFNFLFFLCNAFWIEGVTGKWTLLTGSTFWSLSFGFWLMENKISPG